MYGKIVFRPERNYLNSSIQQVARKEAIFHAENMLKENLNVKAIIHLIRHQQRELLHRGYFDAPLEERQALENEISGLFAEAMLNVIEKEHAREAVEFFTKANIAYERDRSPERNPERNRHRDRSPSTPRGRSSSPSTPRGRSPSPSTPRGERRSPSRGTSRGA